MPPHPSLERSKGAQFLSTIRSRPFLSFLSPAIRSAQGTPASRYKHIQFVDCGNTIAQPDAIEQNYIAALVAAGSCQKRSARLKTSASVIQRQEFVTACTVIQERRRGHGPGTVYLAPKRSRAIGIGRLASRSRVSSRSYTTGLGRAQKEGRDDQEDEVLKEKVKGEKRRQPTRVSILGANAGVRPNKPSMRDVLTESVASSRRQLELRRTIENLEEQLREAREGLQEVLPDVDLDSQFNLQDHAERGELSDGKAQSIASDRPPQPPSDISLTKTQSRSEASNVKDYSLRVPNGDLEFELFPSEPRGPPVIPRGLTKQDILDLVDIYFHSPEEYIAPFAHPSPNPIVSDYGLAISNWNEMRPLDGGDSGLKPGPNVLGPVHEHLLSSKREEFAVMENFLDVLLNENVPTHQLFAAYSKFPKPGVSYLPWSAIRLFLQRMSVPTFKGAKSQIRYLSIIEDMQKASLPITRAEWTSAIYLTARSFTKVTSQHLSSAMSLWNEMENEAGVQASHVTFNVLFDIAVKAQKFGVAEMILKEMQNRQLCLNRLGRVSLIGYFGARGNGDGVRKAYRDFVEAGEIVDTLVMTAVIKALCLAGEPTAAEQVYERMKDLNIRVGRRAASSTNQQSEDDSWLRYPPPGPRKLGEELASNSLGRILLRAWHLQAIGLKQNHAQLQAAMPLKPNLKTYIALFEYHVAQSGDLNRVSVLLDDAVSLFGIRLQDKLYKWLFQGFALHGGSRYSDWTATKLETVWSAYLRGAKTIDELGIEHKPAEQHRSADVRELDRVWSRYDPLQSPDFGEKPNTASSSSIWGRLSGKAFFNDVHPAVKPIVPPTKSDAETATDQILDTDQTAEDVDPGLQIGRKWLVIWALRAFGKCCGRKRTEEVWFDLQQRWRPGTSRDMEVATRIYRSALATADARESRRGGT